MGLQEVNNRKRKRSSNTMAVITVRVGREEKEISGLTRRTTCAEVLEALLRDEQTFQSVCKLNQEIAIKQTFPEIVQSCVIMEDWRGCEKALTPQTRILSVWKAWGDEQRNVKFSLKKDKSAVFNEQTPEKRDCDCSVIHGQAMQKDSNSAQFLSKLSSEQKKRIRRNLMQYQRAVLHQQSKNEIDDNNNSGTQLKHLQHNRNKKSPPARPPSYHEMPPNANKDKVTLSEEQFVDGVITGPLAAHRSEPRNKLIQSALEKTLDNEHCTYRRPHHRKRLIVPDGSSITDHNSIFFGKPSFDHYLSNRSNPKRKSSSERKSYRNRKEHGRVTKQVKDRRLSHSSQNSTDSTESSSVLVPKIEIETRNLYSGDDADDEKSVMTEYGTLLSRQKLGARSIQPRPNLDRLGNATLSTSVATVTDSSTTTSSDTSNTSSSSLSGTSCSDTSASSADIYNENFFARRAAEIAAARANTTEKTKSRPLKLFRMAKPAQSILGSFKRKKKQSPAAPQPNIHPPASKNNESLQNEISLSTTAAKKVEDEQWLSKVTFTSELQKPPTKIEIEEYTRSEEANVSAFSPIEDSETRCSEQLQRQILSQQQTLNEKCKNLNTVNAEVEQLETQIHRLRSQTHGENYVQNIYLTGLDDDHVKTESHSVDKKSPRLSSIPDPVPCINSCDDVNILEDYLKECERVINTQMRIEEQKRQAQIILQDVEDEVWKVANDPKMSPHTRHLTALALGLMPPELDADVSDDEDIIDKSLSVTTGKKNAMQPSQKRKSISLENEILEVEKSRTELEANLNLSLRLSSELDEVDKLMCHSRHLLQSKGETLLDLVRELAQSPGGIPQDLWEEFGELLMAYDAEMALQRYFAACADHDEANYAPTHDAAVKLENTTRQLTASDEVVIDPSSPSANTLYHTSSPSAWVEQQKHHLKQPQSSRTIPVILQTKRRSQSQSSILNSSLPSTNPPVSYSRNRSSSLTTSLLPMPPVPDYNDSDHDEKTQKKNESSSVSHTMISTEDVIPVVVLRHNTSCPANLLSLGTSVPSSNRFFSTRDSLSTIDDSGNASGGSTNSDYASTDGSRNDSCDGDSRPSSVTIDSQDSAYSSPLFLRDHFRQGDNHLQFTYPPQLKSQKEKLSKNSPNILGKNISPKPPVPIKSPAVKHASALAAENKKQPVTLRKEYCLKKQARRNSEHSERVPSALVQDQFFRRISSFGKSSVSPFTLPNQNQLLSSVPKRSAVPHHPTIQKKDAALPQSIAKNTCSKELTTSSLGHSHASHPKQALKTNTTSMDSHGTPTKARILSTDGICKVPHASTSTYENDSDTGLSSLHSTDSFDKLSIPSGETLV